MNHCAQLVMTVQHAADSVTITMMGELDIAVVDDVNDTINELLDEDATLVSMCIDATAVSFVDSTGLGILTQAHSTMADHLVDFTVVAPPGSAVVRLIELCAGEHWFGAPEPDLVELVSGVGHRHPASAA
jgi:anti-anti-sigma factor